MWLSLRAMEAFLPQAVVAHRAILLKKQKEPMTTRVTPN